MQSVFSFCGYSRCKRETIQPRFQIGVSKIDRATDRCTSGINGCRLDYIFCFHDRWGRLGFQILLKLIKESIAPQRRAATLFDALQGGVYVH